MSNENVVLTRIHINPDMFEISVLVNPPPYSVYVTDGSWQEQIGSIFWKINKIYYVDLF